jgi:hypothetical protein
MHLLPTSIALVLYAGTALADVSTTVVTMTAAPLPTSTSYLNNQDFQNDMLAATNFYRSEHGVASLTWNTTSAQYAVNWSSKCNFAHSVRFSSFPLFFLFPSHLRQEADCNTGRTNRRESCGRIRERLCVSRRMGTRKRAL